MRRGHFALSLLLLACGREVPELLLLPGSPTLNASTRSVEADAGAPGPGCGTVPFGPDCCEGGRRVTSATCIADTWTCTSGSFCTCAGQPQPFQCAEYCGSDAFVPPDCVNGEWMCSRPTMPTSTCRADTCWGEPGECCGAPSCVDGGWVCGFRPSGC